jgi:hypothetical protein
LVVALAAAGTLWWRSHVAIAISIFGGTVLALDRPGTIHSYRAPAAMITTKTTAIAMR